MLVEGGCQLTAFRTEFGFQPCQRHLVSGCDEGIDEGRLIPQPGELFLGVLQPDRAVIFGSFGDGGGRHSGTHRIAYGTKGVLLQKVAQRKHFLIQSRTGGEEGEYGLYVFKITLIPQSGHNSGDLAIGVTVGNADQRTYSNEGVQLRRHEIIVRSVRMVGYVQNMNGRKQLTQCTNPPLKLQCG